MAMQNKEVDEHFKPTPFMYILSLTGITILTLLAISYGYLRIFEEAT